MFDKRDMSHIAVRKGNCFTINNRLDPAHYLVNRLSGSTEMELDAICVIIYWDEKLTEKTVEGLIIVESLLCRSIALAWSNHQRRYVHKLFFGALKEVSSFELLGLDVEHLLDFVGVGECQEYAVVAIPFRKGCLEVARNVDSGTNLRIRGLTGQVVVSCS
jgi:hypothetical protein